MKKFLHDQEGQVVVEWLLLTAMAFITAFILVNGSTFQNFTGGMLNDIRSRLGNVVRNGEMDSKGSEQGQGGHPSDPRRMKALHL